MHAINQVPCPLCFGQLPPMAKMASGAIPKNAATAIGAWAADLTPTLCGRHSPCERPREPLRFAGTVPGTTLGPQDVSGNPSGAELRQLEKPTWGN